MGPHPKGQVFKLRVEGRWGEETGGALIWLKATHDTTFIHEQSLDDTGEVALAGESRWTPGRAFHEAEDLSLEAKPGRSDVMMAIAYNAPASSRCTDTPSLLRYDDLILVLQREQLLDDLVSRMQTSWKYLWQEDPAKY
ncbi:hypothetical protein EPR50_G00018730 [Perca flavescens]|uniref:Uncharacterized protein n=1 Tax=Perca flavescens TaxID=8167 RepID=A0A484DMR0_PERFV|nr:hypothetical protein EPR50_G00018730 [Perca flavescens]